jgi:pimeloyl-ACP methyl ester carboxylesterase
MNSLLRNGCATLLLVFCLSRGSVAAPRTAMEEFLVPAHDVGITLYVRNKHPVGLKTVRSERILLFVHGATLPAESSFDLRLNGLSWMDYIAQHGYDVYLLDVRGYGRSTRPHEMEVPPEQNEPIVRTSTAVNDVSAAVDFILKRRRVQKLNLMGWSWGTCTMGWYTAQHHDKVVKLVLYAPWWLRSPPSVTDAGAKLGAYRTVSREAVKSRWLAGVPEDRRAEFLPSGWFEAFAAATFATDPAGAALVPPQLRAPNGVLADARDFWNAGKPLYDPAEIRVPTFLAHAEWDADLPSYMLYAYFEHLVNTPYKRYVQIGEGTHFVVMEKNRIQLFEAVQQFLDEDIRVGQ